MKNQKIVEDFCKVYLEGTKNERESTIKMLEAIADPESDEQDIRMAISTIADCLSPKEPPIDLMDVKCTQNDKEDPNFIHGVPLAYLGDEIELEEIPNYVAVGEPPLTVEWARREYMRGADVFVKVDESFCRKVMKGTVFYDVPKAPYIVKVTTTTR